MDTPTQEDARDSSRREKKKRKQKKKKEDPFQPRNGIEEEEDQISQGCSEEMDLEFGAQIIRKPVTIKKVNTH